MLALRLFLKDKGGGKQHCLIPFVGSNLGVETILKKREHQKRMRQNRGLRHLCKLFIEVSRTFYAKSVCFLILFGYSFWLKALFSFIPWLLNFSDLPNYDSNLRKRYILSKCLVRSTLLPTEDKVPPTLQYPLWFP